MRAEVARGTESRLCCRHKPAMAMRVRKQLENEKRRGVLCHVGQAREARLGARGEARRAHRMRVAQSRR